MIKSITFNNYDLQDSDFRTKDIIYRSIPGRQINIEPYPRRDGFRFLDSYYSEKEITIDGTLTRDTEANLKISLDLMKESLNEEESNLEINDGGTTIQYICTVSNISIPEEHYHITHIPYQISFQCHPFGKETSSIPDSKTITQASDSPYLNTFDPTGSVGPLPVLTWTCSGAPTAAITQIKFENVTTSESITVGSLTLDTNGDYLEVDIENMTVNAVQSGGARTEIDFTGVFPEFKAISNEYSVIVTGGGATWEIEQIIEYYPTYL